MAAWAAGVLSFAEPGPVRMHHDQPGGDLLIYEFAAFHGHAFAQAGPCVLPFAGSSMTSTTIGMSARKISFVLGGARSGKSRFSEELALTCGLERHYIATSQIFDEEMRARIAQHRTQRGEAG